MSFDLETIQNSSTWKAVNSEQNSYYLSKNVNILYRMTNYKVMVIEDTKLFQSCIFLYDQFIQ